jgi:serine/threonine protein kinase
MDHRHKVNPQNIIGGGTFSKVVKDGNIAIKKFTNSYSGSDIREIIFMRLVVHPNVVRLNTVLEQNNCLWLYMRALAGDATTYAWIETKEPLRHLINILYGVAAGLEYMHSLHVIHCDIKPQNILIERRGDTQPYRGVICDFNIATIASTSPLNSRVQTVYYRAPEIDWMRPRCEFGAAIDVWSFGCVVFELLTRRRFIGNDVIARQIDVSRQVDVSRIIEERPNVNAAHVFGVDVAKLMHMRADDVRRRIDDMLYSLRGTWLQSYGFANMPQDDAKSIMDVILIILSQCLMPDPMRRTTMGEVTRELSRIARSFDCPAIEYKSPDIPLAWIQEPRDICWHLGATPKYIDFALARDTLPHVNTLTHDARDESPLREHAAPHKFIYAEKKILSIFADKRALCAVVMLEEAYYQKIARKKELGTRESLLTLCAAAFIISRAFETPGADDVYDVFGDDRRIDERDRRSVTARCSHIMRTLDYVVMF